MHLKHPYSLFWKNSQVNSTLTVCLNKMRGLYFSVLVVTGSLIKLVAIPDPQNLPDKIFPP